MEHQGRVTPDHDDEFIQRIDAAACVPALQNIKQAFVEWGTSVDACLVLLNFANKIRQRLLRRFGILAFLPPLVQAECNQNTDYD
jgi:hypothetical protein